MYSLVFVLFTSLQSTFSKSALFSLSFIFVDIFMMEKYIYLFLCVIIVKSRDRICVKVMVLLLHFSAYFLPGPPRLGGGGAYPSCHWLKNGPHHLSNISMALAEANCYISYIICNVTLSATSSAPSTNKKHNCCEMICCFGLFNIK